MWKNKERSKFYNLNLFLAFFLGLSGYYTVLIILANMGLNSISRIFTIPIRILVLFSFFVLYRSGNKIQYKGLANKLFLFFSFFYLFRILLESLKIDPLYLSELNILLYFLSFVLIPFVILSKLEFIQNDYKNIFWITLVGSVGVAILTFYYYANLIGEVQRITEGISENENFISPLALSYTSVLGISIGISYLLTNKVSKTNLLFILSSIMVCLIPFFLGSSRGSIFAVTIPFVFYLLFSKGKSNKIRFFIFAIVIVFIVTASTDILGYGVFDRFTSMSKDVETGSASAVRIDFWKDGIRQFAVNPIFGNSLQSEYAKFHPHNIFIEILISTGVLGFIPFILFIVIVFRDLIRIIRINQEYFWVTNIFLIGFIQNMFTGAIWGASWTMIGAAMILSISHNKVLKLNK